MNIYEIEERHNHDSGVLSNKCSLAPRATIIHDDRAALIAMVRQLEADKAGLVEALESAIKKVTSEYCSHAGSPCSADNKLCYASEYYQALANFARGDKEAG